MINLIFIFVSIFAFGQIKEVKISPTKTICTDLLIKNGRASADPKQVVELLKAFFPSDQTSFRTKDGGQIDLSFTDNSFQLFGSRQDSVSTRTLTEPVYFKFPTEKYGSFFVIPGRTKVTIIRATPDYLELTCQYEEKLYHTYVAQLILRKEGSDTHITLETKRKESRYFGKNPRFQKFYEWRTKFLSNPLKLVF